jgi:16S rRNA (adenine1518-N6/adenine1519-N6)-dimethyltransferase
LTGAKKSLGQHFLTDERVVDRIIKSVSPQPNDVIVEIGPGRGALTRPLGVNCRFVLAVEADGELAERLAAEIASERIRIVHGDALKVDWKTLIESACDDLQRLDPKVGGHIRVRVVANLPYYISTPILQRLISLRNLIYDMTLMLQNEVIDRMASEPGGREYGYLSVLCQVYCEVEKLFKVSPAAFAPAPEVWSAVVRLQVRQQALVALDDEARFLLLVRSAFAQRRKTILNNLKAAVPALSARADSGSPMTDVEAKASAMRIDPVAALTLAGIDPRRRAETLSIKDFDALYRSLYKEG